MDWEGGTNGAFVPHLMGHGEAGRASPWPFFYALIEVHLTWDSGLPANGCRQACRNLNPSGSIARDLIFDH